MAVPNNLHDLPFGFGNAWRMRHSLELLQM
jgi:hypothetical protein